ncbi:uncharacterized protein METZ01_LOCUS111460 [marine metagenome]|uniref:FlgD/Vpr Ig-like domain-containing protein n=1 Tax=marine metagenome TaxID=408172 RepID=A0A381X1D5_9ZZZZ
MKLERQIRFLLVMAWVVSSAYTQSLFSFVGEWDGTETLASPVDNYESQDMDLSIEKGGIREGFLIFTSSSDVIYNNDVGWAYHYFTFDKNTYQVIFMRRFVTPLGVLGSQELVYDILAWDVDNLIIEYISDDQETIHEMRLNRSMLGTINPQIPVKVSLYPNYPNPFNPKTTIAVDVHKDSKGTLDIFNLQGQYVKTLYDGMFETGIQLFKWDGTDYINRSVSAGTYIYCLSIENDIFSRKMVLLK